MKFYVCSDIHGDYQAAQLAIDAFNRSGAEQLILLGDLINHGPRNPVPEGYDPIAVAALLNDYAERIIAVRGNCDSEVDQALLKFPMLNDYNQLFVARRKAFLCHGHIHGPSRLPLLAAGSIFASGHTHVPVAEQIGEYYLFNPGSVAMPRQNWPASYGLMTESSISVHDLVNDEQLLSCNFS